MAEEFLVGVEVAGGVEYPLAGCMAGLVHPLTGCGSIGDDRATVPLVPATRPEYRPQIHRVWLWSEWPGPWGGDAGIDLWQRTDPDDRLRRVARCS